MSNSNINRRCHVMLGHTRPSSPAAPIYHDPSAPRPGDVSGNLDAYFHTEERRYHALGRLEGNDNPYPAGYDDHIPRNVAAGNRPSSYQQDPEAQGRRQHRQVHAEDLDPQAITAAGAGSIYDPRISQAQSAAEADPYAGMTAAVRDSVTEYGDWAQTQQAEVRQVSRLVARATRDEMTGAPGHVAFACRG